MGLYICICVLVCAQVFVSLSCAPSVFDSDVHTRERVCSYCVHVSVCTPRPYHTTSCLSPIFPCLRAATHIPAGTYTRMHLRPF